MTSTRQVKRGLTSTDVFAGLLILAVVARLVLGDVASAPALAAWTTTFAAICIQASPFLALGVLVSTVIAVAVPPAFFARALPRRPALAVPVAGLAGVALPGCECGSVPVASALISRGVAAGPAVAFLLSAPAINPVVLVATAVAFPGHPAVVLARFVASLITAIVTGWLWTRLGREIPVRPRPGVHGTAWHRARVSASHDLAQALGLLVIGAAAAATLQSLVPPGWLAHLGSNAVIGVVTLSALAVVLAVCSEADAFIAASLTQFSLTARLAFMVVGPAVDVKLVAMQLGTFGRAFAQRFAPLALGVAVLAAALVGTVLL